LLVNKRISQTYQLHATSEERLGIRVKHVGFGNCDSWFIASQSDRSRNGNEKAEPCTNEPVRDTPALTTDNSNIGRLGGNTLQVRKQA